MKSSLCLFCFRIKWEKKSKDLKKKTSNPASQIIKCVGKIENHHKVLAMPGEFGFGKKEIKKDKNLLEVVVNSCICVARLVLVSFFDFTKLFVLIERVKKRGRDRDLASIASLSK